MSNGNPWPRAATVLAVVIAAVLSAAGPAAARSWTALFSEEAHFVGPPPSGAGLAAVDLGASPLAGSTPINTLPNPFDLAISPDATMAYTVNFGACGTSTANEILPVDLTTSPPTAQAPISLGAVGGFGLSEAPDATALYATGCGKLVRVDLTTTPATVGSPVAVALSAIGDPLSVLAGVETTSTLSPNVLEPFPPASETSSRAPSGVKASAPGSNGVPPGVISPAKLIGVPGWPVAVLTGVTTWASTLAAYSVAPSGLIARRPGSPK